MIERSRAFISLLPLLTVLASARSTAAEAPAGGKQLAVLECREQIGRDWPETLVTYYLVSPGEAFLVPAPDNTRGQWGEPHPASPAYVRLAARVKPQGLRLLDQQGREQPFQLSRLRTDAAGNLGSARLSFRTALPRLGTYRYVRQTGAPAVPTTDLRVTENGAYLTLENVVTAIRLPRTGTFALPEPRR